MSTPTIDIHPALAEAMTDFDTPENRAAWEQREVPKTPWMRHKDTTPEDLDVEWRRAVERIAERTGERFARWMANVPARFQAAHLGELTDEQHPADLRRWLGDPEVLNLFIVGAPGRGKTHAAYALANAAAASAAANGIDLPRAWTVPGLLDDLRPSSRGDSETLWDTAKARPLLVLDDLANVRATDWAIERIWMLADARTGDNLRTIITTNAAWPDLEATWGVPTMDRFRDRSAVVKFSGETHRKPAW